VADLGLGPLVLLHHLLDLVLQGTLGGDDAGLLHEEGDEEGEHLERRPRGLLLLIGQIGILQLHFNDPDQLVKGGFKDVDDMGDGLQRVDGGVLLDRLGQEEEEVEVVLLLDLGGVLEKELLHFVQFPINVLDLHGLHEVRGVDLKTKIPIPIVAYIVSPVTGFVEDVLVFEGEDEEFCHGDGGGSH